MAKIIVNVMPKPVLLDPAGKAVLKALKQAGNNSFSNIRVGKTLELHVEGAVTEDLKAEAEKIAKDLFINQELEYVSGVSVEEN